MALRSYNSLRYNMVEYNNYNRLILNDATPATDTLTFSTTRLFVESIVFVDTIAKNVSNKVLSETLRLQDWISRKKNPASNIWGD